MCIHVVGVMFDLKCVIVRSPSFEGSSLCWQIAEKHGLLDYRSISQRPASPWSVGVEELWPRAGPTRAFLEHVQIYLGMYHCPPSKQSQRPVSAFPTYQKSKKATLWHFCHRIYDLTRAVRFGTLCKCLIAASKSFAISRGTMAASFLGSRLLHSSSHP